MSGLDLAAIRRALVAQLRSIPGLFVYEAWPGTPQVLPCAVVFAPDRIDFSKTSQRGLDLATWEVLVLVGPMSPTSQEFLEGVMSGTGERSVIQALYANRKLDGVVSNLRVPEITTGMYAVTTSVNNVAIGCAITVEVSA